MDESTKLTIIKSKILQFDLSIESIKKLNNDGIMDYDEYLTYIAITTEKYLEQLMEEIH